MIIKIILLIIKIILFLFFYSAVYASTPTRQEPNELFVPSPVPSELSARYNNLKNFYYKNFTYFYEVVQGLEKKEVEKKFKQDEWLPGEGTMFSEEILNDIIAFFYISLR